jgi:hypothetical protein
MLVLSAAMNCKPKSSPPGPAASVSTAVPPAPTPPPVPAEPPPPLAAKADEVPALEAKLTKDAAYVKAWTGEQLAERLLLMTAISDLLAYGTLHSDVETSIKKVKLSEPMALIEKVLWRAGKLPTDLMNKVDAHLAANKTAPHLGLWKPDAQGAVPIDATALAMWMHPEDHGYVRERMRALVKGPFRPGKDTPVKRAWLVNMGDVINRLGALGGFTKEDCLDLGARWSEKLGADGGTYFACEPPEEVKPPPVSAEEESLRKACKVSASEKFQPADKAEVVALCRTSVERLLKAPKTAEHAGIFDDGKPTSIDGCTTVYASYVDSQNSFGAMIRTRYLCTYDPRTGMAAAEFVK